MYSNTKSRQIDVVLTIISLLGAAPGIVIGILLIDRKARKDNMMSRVFVFCVFIIQVVVFMMLKGIHKEKLSFAFWEFFSQHKLLVVYLAVINIVTFIAFGIDKLKAVSHKYRIKIITLLGLAFAGGSAGGLLGMYIFRHKTNKDYFTTGIPLIILMQVVVVFFLMNLK
ncbi:MAG: DUF1294 domain-containing protein [Lachnospiraceae bacterium]|nr:DUF1294 domain-containing protein [Lachnospiraceae bacterium]